MELATEVKNKGYHNNVRAELQVKENEHLRAERADARLTAKTLSLAYEHIHRLERQVVGVLKHKL